MWDYDFFFFLLVLLNLPSGIFCPMFLLYNYEGFVLNEHSYEIRKKCSRKSLTKFLVLTNWKQKKKSNLISSLHKVTFWLKSTYNYYMWRYFTLCETHVSFYIF